MTFEEFFKRKKIDLARLQTAEPLLFAEFESHYDLMGEKSFDHTKKYWFNQLRRKYALPPEVKVDKVIIENQLAEQTIVESLTEAAIPAPSVGFKPRFKAGATVQPTEAKPAEPTTPAPAAGFKPRFKAAMVTKPAGENPEAAPVSAEEKKEEPAEEKPAGETAPKPAGFKPRFNAAKMAKPKEPDED